MPRGTPEEFTSRLYETIKQLKAACIDRKEPVTPTDEAAVERWVQLAVQLCIDISDRILTARGIEEPARARDVFPLLASHGVLTRELGITLANLVDLRNNVVHEYIDYSGPGIISEAARFLPALEKAGAMLATALMNEAGDGQ